MIVSILEAERRKAKRTTSNTGSPLHQEMREHRLVYPLGVEGKACGKRAELRLVVMLENEHSPDPPALGENSRERSLTTVGIAVTNAVFLADKLAGENSR